MKKVLKLLIPIYLFHGILHTVIIHTQPCGHIKSKDLVWDYCLQTQEAERESKAHLRLHDGIRDLDSYKLSTQLWKTCNFIVLAALRLQDGCFVFRYHIFFPGKNRGNHKGK
jgi:hypothetical protein